MTAIQNVRWANGKLRVKRESICGKPFTLRGIEDSANDFAERTPIRYEDGIRYELDVSKDIDAINEAVIDATKTYIEHAIAGATEFVNQRAPPIDKVTYDQKADEFVVTVNNKKELAQRLCTIINGIRMFTFNDVKDFIHCSGGINECTADHFLYVTDYAEVYGRDTLEHGLKTILEQHDFVTYVRC